MFYEDVFKAFDEKQVRYLVVGALAMNLHGAPRMTADLDIVVELGNENLRLATETLSELGYRPRLPVDLKDLLSPEKRAEWKTEKGLMAFTFIHPKIQYQEVDLLLEMPIPFEEAEKDKKIITTKSLRIPVISLDHLITMKNLAGRKQDQADIEVLRRIKGLVSGETHDA